METNGSSDSITEAVEAESERHLNARSSNRIQGEEEKRGTKKKPHKSFCKQLIRPSITATTLFFREPKKKQFQII